MEVKATPLDGSSGVIGSPMCHRVALGTFLSGNSSFDDDVDDDDDDDGDDDDDMGMDRRDLKEVFNEYWNDCVPPRSNLDNDGDNNGDDDDEDENSSDDDDVMDDGVDVVKVDEIRVIKRRFEWELFNNKGADVSEDDDNDVDGDDDDDGVVVAVRDWYWPPSSSTNKRTPPTPRWLATSTFNWCQNNLFSETHYFVISSQLTSASQCFEVKILKISALIINLIKQLHCYPSEN